MQEYIEKAQAWIKENRTTAAIIGAVLLGLILFGKKLFRSASRRRRRLKVVHRSLPRKSRAKSRGPAQAKKPWQVKGSLAAKRRMAELRRRRRALYV